jgi:hypothetical protein
MSTLVRSQLIDGPAQARRHHPVSHDHSTSLAVSVEGPGVLSKAEWESLFHDHPLPFADISLGMDAGMDGLVYRFILVRKAGKLVLAIPIFECTFDVSAMVRGRTRMAVRWLGTIARPMLRPRLLGIGLVEGEWGSIGVARDADPGTMTEAWRLAGAAFEVEASRTRAQMLVLLDLGPDALPRLPDCFRARFEPVGTSPCARLPLPFSSLEEYLATLSRTTRQKLRRRVRAAAQHVRVERTRNISPHLDTVYRLYRDTVDRAPVSLGVHRRTYFERVCRDVEGAEFVLYWLDGALIAFNLVIAHGGTLLDKYFCMDPGPGREHNLYFVSWMENIQSAIARGLTLYHAGQGAEETKAHMGCEFVRTTTMFRHTNPLAHRVLACLSRRLVGSTTLNGEGAAV